MENVYSPENLLATEPIDMCQYFQEYSQVCPLRKVDKKDEQGRTLELFYSKKEILKDEFGIEFNEKELLLMEETCSTDKLRAKHEVPELPLLSPPVNHLIEHCYKINKNSLALETVKCKQRFNSIQKDLFFGLVVKNHQYSEENDEKVHLVKDILPGSTFIYNIVLYKPFNTLTEKRLTIENILSMSEFEVLGTNTLTQLCDKIKCVSDKFLFRPVENTKVDLEEFMDPINTHPSRAFFIENSFYCDTRHENATNYTDVVIEWAKSNNIGAFEKKSMEVRIDSLKPRLGFGYVYIHQGKCEHVLTFSDARLVQSTDCLVYSEYPKSLIDKSKGNHICFICRHQQAAWLVIDSDKLPVARTFFCTTCCDSYMFLNGEKIGYFKLYPYYHENADVEKVDCTGSGNSDEEED